MFAQSPKDFISSKTNLTGLSMIVIGIVGLTTGSMETIEGTMMICNGVGFIAVKDAVVKR